MFSRRIILWIGLALAALLACLGPRDRDAATISARELLTRTQRLSQANYTFDQTTSAALAAAEVPEPAENASQETLESALGLAGFVLRPVGPPATNVFLVEKSGG